VLNGLDLFSGIGGLSVALAPWVRTVAYCECEPYAQAVLLSRQASGDVDVAPIWDDITTLAGFRLPDVDIIYGGFPCQDISVAGNGRGLEGERSGLFFEVCRLVDEIKPPFVFLENVQAIRTRGGERVGKELAARGYDC
jgi:DNA (cytosine-5)-methyltransferase 1